MARTSRAKDARVKALQAFMAKEKKHSENAKYEWELAHNTSNERGHVFDQWELKKTYYNKVSWSDRDKNRVGCGWSKVTWLVRPDANDTPFEYVVVKRHKHGRFDSWGCNQVDLELRCYLKFAGTEEQNYLCPILKYFTTKSDHNNPNTDTAIDNIVLISQRAVFVGDYEDSAYEAKRLNKEIGIEYDANRRSKEILSFSREQGWFDIANGNDGNCGVIYDYSKNRYEAVIIDYAL